MEEGNKRLRTQLRREFTTLANKIDTATEQASEELFELLADTASNLFQVETIIREQWCAVEKFDEKRFEEDQDTAMTYRIRWHKIKARFSRKRHDSDKSLQSAESSFKATKKRLPKLPKLDIPNFDGKITSWLQFWGQFKKIHDNKDIDQTDKFQYLIQAMVPNTNAHHLIRSYPPSGDNYQKAIDALKARFARDDLLIETYVRGLLTLMQNKGEATDLSTLYDNIQTHLQALETLSVTKDKYAAMLFPMIESALPEEVLRAWHRSHQPSRDLSSLMELLRHEVESEERIRLARGLDDLAIEPKPPTACFLNKSKKEIAQNKHSTSNVVYVACVWCDKNTHSATECHKATKMEYKDRVEFLKSKKVCQICFKSNHSSKKCKSYPKCLFCKKRHYTIMCSDLANVNNNNTHDGSQPTSSSNNLSCQPSSKTTLLQTFVAKIVHGKKKILVRALIDSGAQRSYIKKDIVEKLGLQSIKKEVLSHSLFGGLETTKQECRLFDICLRSIVNKNNINLCLVEQKNICGLLPKVRSSKLLGQLRQKQFFLTDSTDDSPDDVNILIGADNSGTLLTSEYLQLENNLTAINTKMGWTIQGSVTGVYSSAANLTTTLHCLDNGFRSLNWDKIQRFSSKWKWKWNFLPPAAPWWGGFYERMIGFLKQILRRVLGRAALSLVEFQTVLCDCETVINSRPLLSPASVIKTICNL